VEAPITATLFGVNMAAKLSELALMISPHAHKVTSF